MTRPRGLYKLFYGEISAQKLLIFQNQAKSGQSEIRKAAYGRVYSSIRLHSMSCLPTYFTFNNCRGLLINNTRPSATSFLSVVSRSIAYRPADRLGWSTVLASKGMMLPLLSVMAGVSTVTSLAPPACWRGAIVRDTHKD